MIRTYANNNYFFIQNIHSGKCLDTPGGNAADNVGMQQWDCSNGNVNQAYMFKVADWFTLQQHLEFAAINYAPIDYIHENEQYFPTTIEKLAPKWSTVKISDPNAIVDININAQPKFDNTAPLYVSIQKTPTGYSIGYGVIFGFNNCGPKASLSANTYSPVGKVGFTNTMIDLCPADKHNGDLEHAIVNIDFDFSVISVDVAYHQWDALRYPNQMNWEFGHPVIYMAVGSHAHYPTPGPQNYYEVFNVSSGKNVQDCPTICHKTVNIPYPCTVSCSWGLFEGVCPSTCHHDVSVPYPCL